MRRIWLVPLAFFMLVAVIVGIGIFASRRGRGKPTGSPRGTLVQIPQGYLYRRDWAGRHLDITPDGKKIVYAGQAKMGTARLYVQTIGETTAMELAGTESSSDPSVSPDGRDVAFYADQSIKKAAIDGSGVTVIGRSPPVRGIAWMDADTLILGPVQGNLLRMTISTGDSIPLGESTEPSVAHLHPYVLPSKRGVLFTLAQGQLSNARIGVISLADGKERLLLNENAFAPTYLPTGHVVFAHGPRRELAAARFNLNTLEIIGAPRPLLQSALSGVGVGGTTDYAFSSSGTLIYTERDPTFDDALAAVAGLDLTSIHVVEGWFDVVKRIVP
jgi:WD40-like Beta Propeller Repeat